MNEGRFDELALGLATNRLSRGQVLKSLASGLLLAGPLGALARSRPASAQTTDGCTESTIAACVKKAKKAYARCTRRCERLRGKKKTKCQRACSATLKSQKAACQCTVGCPSCGSCKTIELDTAAGSVTFGSCQGSCVAATLCSQAKQDTEYKKLEGYLSSNGFAVVTFEDTELTSAGQKHQAFEVYEDGTKIQTALVSEYYKQSTDEKATLRYGVDQSEQASPFASVFKGTESMYLLAVDSSGTVQKVLPPDILGWPSSSSTAASSSRSSSEKLASNSSVSANARVDNGIDLTNLCSWCGPLCNAFGPGAVGAFLGRITSVAAAKGAAVISLEAAALVPLFMVIGSIGAASWLSCQEDCNPQALLDMDRHNCGGCGNGPCSANEDCCGGQCTDVVSNWHHCGNCGVHCGDGQQCVESTCQNDPSCDGITCPTDQICMSGVCVPKPCSNGSECGGTCVNGTCTPCPDGKTLCDKATGQGRKDCCDPGEICCGPDTVTGESFCCGANSLCCPDAAGFGWCCPNENSLGEAFMCCLSAPNGVCSTAEGCGA